MDTIASREKLWPLDTMEEKRQFTDKFMLRLPDGMRDRIKSAADLNGRSMNAEIIAILEEEYPPASSSPEMQRLHKLITKHLNGMGNLTDAEKSEMRGLLTAIKTEEPF